MPDSSPPTTTTATDVRPFANHSEFEVWDAANCSRCALNGYARRGAVDLCPMEEALSIGALIGTVPADLATKYGATVRGEYADMPRECAQFVPFGLCESISTRNRRKCGKPATATIEHHGHTYPTCAHHRRTYLAALNKETRHV